MAWTKAAHHQYYLRQKAEKGSWWLTKEFRERRRAWRATAAGRASDNATNQRERDRRAIAVRKAKDKPCADCGRRFPYWVMDFDHVRGRKKLQIGSKHHPVKVLLQEIAKCDVVCANCHRTRTHRRRGE